MLFFAGGVDDLNAADCSAAQLCNELFSPVGVSTQLSFPGPVVVRVWCDNVGLLVPVGEEG